MECVGITGLFAGGLMCHGVCRHHRYSSSSAFDMMVALTRSFLL